MRSRYPRSVVKQQIAAEIQRIGARLAEKNGGWFDAEMDKLDRWAEDQRTIAQS